MYKIIWPVMALAPWHAAACIRLWRSCQTVDTFHPDLFELITAMLFSLPTGLAGDHSG
jgi:hypothetical protein